MANIVITTTSNTIDIDFGDYNDGDNSPLCKTFRREDIRDVDIYNDYVLMEMDTGEHWYFVYTSTDNYQIIDSIDSSEPTSNTDLYSKLKALM